MLHDWKYASKRSEFLGFYCYLCHVCYGFLCLWIRNTKISENSDMAKSWATFCCPGTYKNNYQSCCGIKAFNKDDTYTEISENETLNGTFEYFPNRYMFVTYYTNDWGQGDWKEENIIYTIVKITEDELILNNNGHSDIIIFKRK